MAGELLQRKDGDVVEKVSRYVDEPSGADAFKKDQRKNDCLVRAHRALMSPRVVCILLWVYQWEMMRGVLWTHSWSLKGEFSATRRLLAMDLVILSQGRVMRTTPELAPSPPNFHTAPTGGSVSVDRRNVHRPLTW
ncbi:hypothetical protein TNCV_4196111 [Trichonephila clavipes]|nr:hypothetical protein TNCV_4196111 [Trichonephila clavipes]